MVNPGTGGSQPAGSVQALHPVFGPSNRYGVPRFLDSCPSVRKACQVLPESSDHFPPDKELKGAIDELANEMKAHISNWETQVASP